MHHAAHMGVMHGMADGRDQRQPPAQIQAQLPFLLAGDATMTLRSPAGVSNNFTFTVYSAAPSVFRAPGAVPTVVRAVNNELVTPSNPVHP